MAEAEKLNWFRALLRDYEGRLLRYGQRFVGAQASREIVQEVYARLWQEGPSQIQGREKEWLFCVCRNLALDHWRKEKRLDYRSVEESAPPEAESAMELKEQKGAMQAALKLLTAAQQEVVKLKFQESLSYGEISRITGHSVSHVGVLLHESMKKLRTHLGGVK